MTCTIFIHAFFAHIFFSSCILLAKRKPLRPQPSRGHIILLCQSQSIVYEGRTITWQAKQWNYEVFPPCARAVIKFGRILSDVNQNWFKGLKLTSLLELAHLKQSLIRVKTWTKVLVLTWDTFWSNPMPFLSWGPWEQSPLKAELSLPSDILWMAQSDSSDFLYFELCYEISLVFNIWKGIYGVLYRKD